jgi:hypothetical protein
MPLNGNLTLTSLKVRLGMFSLFPVHRLTSGLTVFAGFFKPSSFPQLVFFERNRDISRVTRMLRASTFTPGSLRGPMVVLA